MNEPLYHRKLFGAKKKHTNTNSFKSKYLKATSRDSVGKTKPIPEMVTAKDYWKTRSTLSFIEYNRLTVRAIQAYANYEQFVPVK